MIETWVYTVVKHYKRMILFVYLKAYPSEKIYALFDYVMDFERYEKLA